MARYRQIHLTFWHDPFIEELSPLEKYFYLYLMTNSRTTQCGCYEISMKLVKYETGLTQKQVDEFIKTLEKGKKIKFNKVNNEFLIVNWLKHNSFRSPKVLTCVLGEVDKIKTGEFAQYINSIIQENTSMDRLSIVYDKSIDTGLQEEEERKEEEEEVIEPKKELSEFEKVVEDFKKHRRQMKSPMTNRAVELLLIKLSKLANNDDDKIAIMNQSIENGWKGIFELKSCKISKSSNGIYVAPSFKPKGVE